MSFSVRVSAIRENRGDNARLGNERGGRRLRFRPRPDWRRAVPGVAWLQCQKTRAGVVYPPRRRRRPPPSRWLVRLEAPRPPLVWREGLLDVCVCVSFPVHGVLEG